MNRTDPGPTPAGPDTRHDYEPPELMETIRLKSIVQQFPSEPPPPGREP